MPAPSEVVYTQVEAEAVIFGRKRMDRLGFAKYVGDPGEPSKVSVTSDLTVIGGPYNPAEFGKPVLLSISIRKADGFTFALTLDRTPIHRFDYQWRGNVTKSCKCRDFQMAYEPHEHTYDEPCYRRHRTLWLDQLEAVHETFQDALQAYVEYVHIDWDPRLATRFGKSVEPEFWSRRQQRALWGPVEEVTLGP